MVAFLDLSAAFDTLDHQIMLKRLSAHYGIQGKALQWLSSYLSGCQQSVIIGSISSKPVSLQFVVTQGSVLGPILFTLYSQPFSNIIQKHQCDYLKYTDDTEYQKAAPLSDFSQVSRETKACVPDVKVWMNKTNSNIIMGKTNELLGIGDRICLSSARKEPLTFPSS